MNVSGEVLLAINVIEEKERSKIMEQGKSNSSTITHSENNNDVFHRAQKLYEQYHTTNDENLFTQLIAITDTVYGKRTRNLLKQILFVTAKGFITIKLWIPSVSKIHTDDGSVMKLVKHRFL